MAHLAASPTFHRLPNRIPIVASQHFSIRSTGIGKTGTELA
jgi:hypothetical protein